MDFLRSVSLFIILLVTIEFRQVRGGLQKSLMNKYDGYGEDWIFMPDGHGNTQVAMLKGDQPIGRKTLDERSITYTLYTRSDLESGTRLFIDDLDSLKKSNFSPHRKTKIITHGWKSSSNSPGQINIKTAYLDNGDYNVIMVDWEPLSSSIFYHRSVKNTVMVGNDVAKLIEYLVREAGLKTEDVHFIGHSLGAHVAGITGESMKSKSISRITGLDPALVGYTFMHNEISGRLDATDAHFVDVIHSCGGHLGWDKPLGDVDFYPNGGVAVQPGCWWHMEEVVGTCSHGRAYVYFAESISNSTKFSASKCASWSLFESAECSAGEDVSMGEYVERSAMGSYYLRTRSEAPFGTKYSFFNNNN